MQEQPKIRLMVCVHAPAFGKSAQYAQVILEQRKQPLYALLNKKAAVELKEQQEAIVPEAQETLSEYSTKS
jgi:hypothetical protein